MATAEETSQDVNVAKLKEEENCLNDNTQSSVECNAESYREATTKQVHFHGNIMEEVAEVSGTIETAKVDETVKEWENSFFKDNPQLRKKSVSITFELHLAAENETQPKEDKLPSTDIVLTMRKSCQTSTGSL
ncbi:keratin-like protein KRT222 [Mixophyes fleayi]|uniref:keratin-like protein KRT222 n=1 Tax=Mixophyes fleayi TaxID=3061075 RepID=UPI003F4DBEDC